MRDIMRDAMEQAQREFSVWDDAATKAEESFQAWVRSNETASCLVGTGPKVRVVPELDSDGVCMAIEWIRLHGDRFCGCWVALSRGELVACSLTYIGLIDVIGKNHGMYVAKM